MLEKDFAISLVKEHGPIPVLYYKSKKTCAGRRIPNGRITTDAGKAAQIARMQETPDDTEFSFIIG